MKPVVALVGRPNVGKSTLFNRLTRSRLALVADEPGVTRDRLYGDGRVGDRPYYVVDTGGIAETLLTIRDVSLAAMVARQTQQAVAEADAVIFVTDVRQGVTAGDREIAAGLRRTGKPVWLAANKAEGMNADVAAAEFHALGLGAPHAVSASHGEGIQALMTAVLESLPAVEEPPVGDVPRIAVIGRPNAGKSTLVNALLGEERVVVSDMAGTTRDAIRIPLEFRGRRYIVIDTAGVRRRPRIEEAVEKFSVLRTMQAIDEANVVILVVDGVAGMGEQDAVLAGYALERGRAIVIAVNKWDALDASEREWVKREVERKLPFASFARVHYISALEHTGTEALFRSCDEAFAAGGRDLPTARLNRVLERAIAATPPPIARGHRIKPKFAHQAGRYPPTIVVHGSLVGLLPKAYRRYLANVFREAFDLMGTPVRIECEQQENPYAERKPRSAKKRKSRARKR